MPDETDFRILASIAQDPFASYENIGRRLSLTGTAVKARIDALLRREILEGIRGLPAASLFGRHARIFHFEHQRPDRELLHRVIRTDPVVAAGLHHDSVLGVLAYVEDPDAAVPDGLADLLGRPASATTLLPPAGTARDPVPSSLELKVMRHLVLEARTAPTEIARRTGLSLRTVRRVRQDLVSKGLLQVVTNLQAARSPGMLIHMVMMHFDQERSSGVAAEAYPESFVVSKLRDPPGRILLSKGSSLGEVVEQREKARKMPGVADVRILLDLLVAFNASRLEGWIDRELEKWRLVRLTRAPGRRASDPVPAPVTKEAELDVTPARLLPGPVPPE
jgi:DNA-binding Lrp family transcriptional regulator